MQAIEQSARGLWLLIDLNWERLAFPATIIVGLCIGALIGAELNHFNEPAFQYMP